jgi:hypothetical protein
MNAALERLIKRLDSVRGQEEDALEVLEQAQEDADEGVAVDVLVLALLEEHVGLVQQQHGAPRVRNIHDLVELVLDARVRAQVTRRHGVERALEVFGDALGLDIQVSIVGS